VRFCSSLYSEGHLGVHAGGSQTRTGINHVCLAESEEFHADHVPTRALGENGTPSNANQEQRY